jgi:hypothetical protein
LNAFNPVDIPGDAYNNLAHIARARVAASTYIMLERVTFGATSLCDPVTDSVRFRRAD